MKRDSTYQFNIRPIQFLLDRQDVTEICINRPCEVAVEGLGGWEWHDIPEFDLLTLETLANSIAGFSHQDVNNKHPICSSILPTGEQVQILIPPAVPIGTISMTIRKPSSTSMTLAEFRDKGLFNETKAQSGGISEIDKELMVLRDAAEWVAFFTLAVRSRKNILISGATGSGKTSFSKGLLHLIPDHERILTIEDTRELTLPHRNVVHMTYAKDGNGVMKAGAKELLESALRMRPDRIMLQELRDGTAFFYLRNVNSGHPGSITTVHANSAAGALEQLTLLVKESEAGSDLGRDDIRGLLRSLVDVIVQMKKFDPQGGEPAKYRMTEVFFEPATDMAAHT